VRAYRVAETNIGLSTSIIPQILVYTLLAGSHPAAKSRLEVAFDDHAAAIGTASASCSAVPVFKEIYSTALV